jgi:hypothetical protein
MRRKLISSVLVFLVGYCGIYTGLTLSGAYIPYAQGTNGIKDWVWAPCGFAYKKHGRFPTALGWLFYPLWRCDVRYWHNDWTGQNGPRHTI